MKTGILTEITSSLKSCGLKEAENSNAGTFTNFAQNETLYALHTYLMFLKFGFGRANQDASIEIRRGAMDRAQAVNLVRLYDGQYPQEFLETYLDYYQMSHSEFDGVLDRWANKELFEKVDGFWKPLFKIIKYDTCPYNNRLRNDQHLVNSECSSFSWGNG